MSSAYGFRSAKQIHVTQLSYSFKTILSGCAVKISTTVGHMGLCRPIRGLFLMLNYNSLEIKEHLNAILPVIIKPMKEQTFKPDLTADARKHNFSNGTAITHTHSTQTYARSYCK